MRALSKDAAAVVGAAGNHHSRDQHHDPHLSWREWFQSGVSSHKSLWASWTLAP